MAKSYLDKDGLLYFLQKIRPSATPLMDGTASTGTSKRFAAEDHVHPSDTTKAPLASPALTGTPTAPTATTGTTTTQIATTEFVANAVAASTSGVSDVRVDSTSVVTSGVANIALVGANGTKGVVKNGSSVTSTSGLTASPIISGVPYYKDTTYSNATTSTAGLMSSTDKTRLDTFWNYGAIIRPASTSDIYIGFEIANDSSDSYSALRSTARGAANGVCPLNASSKIDSTYLPSYVDDVIEAYPRSGQTELSQNWLSLTSGGSALTPESGKIYILMADSTSYATNTQFRWSGSAYVKMMDGGVSAITNAEIDVIVAA